jgi:hypothetical protein
MQFLDRALLRTVDKDISPLMLMAGRGDGEPARSGSWCQVSTHTHTPMVGLRPLGASRMYRFRKQRVAWWPANTRHSIVLLLALWVQAACAPCDDIDFRSLNDADRIVVKYMSKTVLTTIHDSQAIARAASFAQSRTRGWADRIAGTPIGTLSVDFYAGEKFVGGFGIGDSFLTAQGCDAFVSRSLSGKDRREIMRILDIQDPPESR